MKKILFVVACVGFSMSTANSAFAIKQLNDQFKKVYAGDKADEGFKALVAEAKCNVCHVDKENKKQVHNPFGEALRAALKEDEFPLPEFKKDQEKFADRLKDIFKKIEEKESGDAEHKTFGKRIEANLLPGGDKDGKGLGK